MTVKDLRRLMPQDSHDVATAGELVLLGPKQLAPVASEMLRQMKDPTSPVAQVYAEFFATHGESFAMEIARFLSRPGMEFQKYMIVGQVLPGWSTASVSMCSVPLQQLVTTNSGVFDTDLRSIQLLAKHQLADREWLLNWISFKREAFSRLTLLLDEVAAAL